MSALKLIDNLAVAIRQSDGIGYAISHEATHTKAYKTRFETIRDWAKCKDEDIKVISNKPIKGFSLSDSFKRSSYFGSGNTIWRIKDPRGFELELYSESFSKLLCDVNIIKGEIQDECYWSKSGNNWVLIPLNSDVHQEYLKTVNISQKDKLTLPELRNVTIGTRVIIRQNNVEKDVIFVGEHYYSTFYEDNVNKQSSLYSNECDYIPLVKHNNKSFFFADDDNGKMSVKDCYVGQYKSPDIIRVSDDIVKIDSIRDTVIRCYNIAKGSIIDSYDIKIPDKTKYFWKDMPRKDITTAITNDVDLIGKIINPNLGKVAFFRHCEQHSQYYYTNGKVYNPDECVIATYPIVDVIISKDENEVVIKKSFSYMSSYLSRRNDPRTIFLKEDYMIPVLCYSFNGNDYVYETNEYRR